MKPSPWSPPEIELDLNKYEKQSFTERLNDGITVDRSRYLSFGGWSHGLLDLARSGDSAAWMGYMWREKRRMSWPARRRINAKIRGLSNIHKQMDELLTPVLYDLLSSSQPTVKDCNRGSGKDGKQARRIRERYGRVVSKPRVSLILRQDDGTYEAHPSMIRRNMAEKDERIKAITTPYSSPGIGTGSFEPRMFLDAAYVGMERRLWDRALDVLGDILGSSGILPEGSWLAYHIVNNDIAMHVIFDNIAQECEVEWLKNNRREAMNVITGMYYGDDIVFPSPGSVLEEYPYTKQDGQDCMEELGKFLEAFDEVGADGFGAYAVGKAVMERRLCDMMDHAIHPFVKKNDWEVFYSITYAMSKCPERLRGVWSPITVQHKS